MVRGKISGLQGLVGFGLLAAAFTAPSGCGEDAFTGCEQTGTCEPASGSGGDAGAGGETDSGTGGAVTGGSSSGSSSGGRAGSSGSTGTDGGEGGEGGDDATGGQGGAPEPPDTTPPTIVSVSPAEDATGVHSDANIIITFSEPMDRGTTHAAYQSADIPGVTFSWDESSTTVTVTPNSDLSYATGDLDVAAQAFAVTIADTAEDEVGNRLADDFAWSFRTLRRITQTFATGSEYAIRSVDGNDTVSVPCPTSPFALGDYGTLGQHKLFSRDIDELPEGIVEWESANLTGNQVQVVGTPYDGLGDILAYHTSIFPPSSSSWTGPNLRELGPFSTDATLGTKSVDVLEALVDDYEHRVERMQTSQYRLVFERINDGDSTGDNVTFECSIRLIATYLIP